MLEAVASSTLSNLDLSKVVLAIGGLGTAAYGVVDVSKGFWGAFLTAALATSGKLCRDSFPPRRNPMMPRPLLRFRWLSRRFELTGLMG